MKNLTLKSLLIIALLLGWRGQQFLMKKKLKSRGNVRNALLKT